MRSDLSGVKDDVATLSANFEAFKELQEQRYRELESKYEAQVSSIKVQVPTLSVAEQCSVQKQFDDLLKEARGMQATFVIGIIPGERPSVSVRTLLERHFSKHGAKLLAASSAVKSRVRRFSVPVENVPEVKSVIRHYNLAIRDLGWWVMQDTPPALRTLYSTAYNFFKLAKEQFTILRRFRFEAEEGYATINGTPFMPVYLIPKRQTAWKKLAALLTEVVADYLDKDWLETACSRLTVPDAFHQRWCDIIEAAKLNQQVLSGSSKEAGPEAATERRLSSPESSEDGSTIHDSSNDGDFEMGENVNTGGG
jgi:hypothetical protein